MRLIHESGMAVLADKGVSIKNKRRGTVGIILDGGWGEVGVTKITDAETVSKNPLYRKSFVSDITDILLNAAAVYVCRPQGGAAAVSAFGCARYEGAAGNSIIIVSEAMSGDIDCFYNVTTYAGNVAVDRQTVKTMSDLADNEYVIFNREAELFATAGLPMTGGVDCEITSDVYAECLAMFDSYDIDILACVDTAWAIEWEFTNYIVKRRARGDAICGISPKLRNFDGIVSVYYDGLDTSFMIPYTAGIIAFTPFYKTVRGAVYNGIREPLAYDEFLPCDVPGNGIVFVRNGNGVYLYSCDNGFFENRPVHEIEIRINRLFDKKYKRVITDSEGGLLRLRNDIKSILDGIYDAYGICRTTSVDVFSDGGGNVSVKLIVDPLKRPEDIRINAAVYP